MTGWKRGRVGRRAPLRAVERALCVRVAFYFSRRVFRSGVFVNSLADPAKYICSPVCVLRCISSESKCGGVQFSPRVLSRGF